MRQHLVHDLLSGSSQQHSMLTCAYTQGLQEAASQRAGPLRPHRRHQLPSRQPSPRESQPEGPQGRRTARRVAIHQQPDGSFLPSFRRMAQTRRSGVRRAALIRARGCGSKSRPQSWRCHRQRAQPGGHAASHASCSGPDQRVRSQSRWVCMHGRSLGSVLVSF